jgi:hypothetical protein
MSETALKNQVHRYVDMLPSDQIIIINDLLSILVSNEPETIIETDLTEEEHAIIEASRRDYKNDPGSFVSLSD